jgi:hypothetical protein
MRYNLGIKGEGKKPPRFMPVVRHEIRGNLMKKIFESLTQIIPFLERS